MGKGQNEENARVDGWNAQLTQHPVYYTCSRSIGTLYTGPICNVHQVDLKNDVDLYGQTHRCVLFDYYLYSSSMDI